MKMKNNRRKGLNKNYKGKNYDPKYNQTVQAPKIKFVPKRITNSKATINILPSLTQNFNRILGDCIVPKISYWELMRFYYINPFHASCINLKAKMIARKCRVVPVDETLDIFAPEPTRDADFDFLLGQKVNPNERTNESLLEIIKKTERDYEITGHGFIEINRNAINGLVSMRYKPAHLFYKSVSRRGWWYFGGKDNIRYYRNFNDDLDPFRGELEVVRIENDDPLQDWYGMPSAQSAFKYMKTEDSTWKYVKSFMDNGGEDIMVWFMKTNIFDHYGGQEEFSRLLQREHVGAENQHGTLVIPVQDVEDVKMEKMSSDFRADRITELLVVANQPVLIAHDVPASVLGFFADKGNTDTDFKNQMNKFLESVVIPRQEFWETILAKLFFVTNGINTHKIDLLEFDPTTLGDDVGALSQVAIALNAFVESQVYTKEEAKVIANKIINKLKL